MFKFCEIVGLVGTYSIFLFIDGGASCTGKELWAAVDGTWDIPCLIRWKCGKI